MSQAEFGERIGIPQTTVSAIEAGQSPPSLGVCIELAGIAEDATEALWFLKQAGADVDTLISVARKVEDKHMEEKIKEARAPMTVADATKLVKYVNGPVKIHVTSTVKGRGAEKIYTPVIVEVSSESDITPEVLLGGKGRKSGLGEVNIYVTKDGKKLYFIAKTGELIGWK